MCRAKVVTDFVSRNNYFRDCVNESLRQSVSGGLAKLSVAADNAVVGEAGSTTRGEARNVHRLARPHMHEIASRRAGRRIDVPLCAEFSEQRLHIGRTGIRVWCCRVPGALKYNFQTQPDLALINSVHHIQDA